MKTKPLRYVLGMSMLALMLLATACSGTQKASGDSSAMMANQSLFQRLRKEPNVRVTGTEENATVYVSNIQGVSGGRQAEPLFVLNGNPVGTTYNQAMEMLRGKEIDSVKVLKSTIATVQYGERASGGAIVIHTKDAK